MHVDDIYIESIIQHKMVEITGNYAMQEFQQHLFIHKYQPRCFRTHPFVGKSCDNISLKTKG